MARERSEIVRIAGRDVEVVWSARRKRTVSARVDGERIVIRAPLRAAGRELEPVFARLVQRVVTRANRKNVADPKNIGESDAALSRRAKRLAAKHFQGGRLPPFTIEWSRRMTRRFGVCHPATRVIRISATLARMPDWVLDYLIVHELAHLVRADHSPGFWELVSAYPRWREARAFLQGYGYGRHGLAEKRSDPADGLPEIL